jgi:hypothetical protein
VRAGPYFVLLDHEDVPEVVEASMGMLGVDPLQVREPTATFVDKDEGVDLLVRHLVGGQGLQEGLPHDLRSSCVLHEDGFAFRHLELLFHYSSFWASLGAFCNAPGRGLKTLSGGHQLERRVSASQPAVAAPAS